MDLVHKINNKFGYYEYCGLKVIVMIDNGYINATRLCSDAMINNGSRKPFFKWKTNMKSQRVIENAGKMTGLIEKDLIIQIKSGSKYLTETRGTYVHPILITSIALWCSDSFCMLVCQWIEEWKKYSLENHEKYWNAISNITTDCNSLLEEKIKNKLALKLGGTAEVETPVGYIDILTDELIIEVKKYDNWKFALGQILSYSQYYPDRFKMIYLFDTPTKNNLKTIREVCHKYDVYVKSVRFVNH